MKYSGRRLREEWEKKARSRKENKSEDAIEA
jgi:hypothetical protein